MSRMYPSRPLVGVGVLIRDGERFLLVKRASEPSKGLWSIPGGLVELGEKAEEAARREVMEETGLDVEIEKLLEVIDNIVRDDEGRVLYHYIIVDFLGHPVGGELKATSDVEDARWVRAHEIKEFKITGTLTHLLKGMEIP